LAVMTVIQNLQCKVRQLEEERNLVTQRCDDLKHRMSSLETNTKHKLNTAVNKTKNWTSAQIVMTQRLEENRKGIEKVLACLSEEYDTLNREVLASQSLSKSLEESRRTLEARAKANRDRQERLQAELVDSEQKMVLELTRAMQLEATCAERERVLEAKVSASEILQSTLDSELESLETDLGGSEEVLSNVMTIVEQVTRLNAKSKANPIPPPDPHYTMATAASAKQKKAQMKKGKEAQKKDKVHPCIRSPCRSCRKT